LEKTKEKLGNLKKKSNFGKHGENNILKTRKKLKILKFLGSGVTAKHISTYFFEKK
jgi:hypothetical protein